MTESSASQDQELTTCKDSNLTYCNQNGYAQAVPHLEANTLQERIKELLILHNLQELSALTFQLSEKYKIHPALPVCIAKADTSLGRYLKTKFNIGNVWNTDSWKTRTPSSLAQGYEAIFRTLNNKYLGRYTQLWELTRKHNHNWPVYATSPENHFNNTANCLELLLQTPVDHTWNFRI